MLTRKEKRNREKNQNYFFDLLKIQRHFFKDFITKLKKVKDPRHQSYITYETETMLYTALLKNIIGIDTMRNMTVQFNTDECIENVKTALSIDELEELPHYDTINDFLSKLEMEELEKIRTYMIKALLKKRCFESYRILDKYWPIIVDGTGLHTFREKHCEHCLRREYKDEETGETTTVYMHHVLEAKLVVGNMVFSVASEFIENESEDTPKQDCELNAFKRLAKNLKQTFKRLPICLLGDSLYACHPVFDICEQNNWKYIFRLKEGRLKNITTEFQAIKSLEKTKKDDKPFWVNHMSFNDKNVHLLEAVVEAKGKKQQLLFITNNKITERNVDKLILAGRNRWKIENEGFNHQKNGWHHIEHVNCHNYQAMKNHYLLVQIADIIVQLYLNGAKLLKRLRKSAKEISSDLLEAIRRRKITDEDINQLGKPIQIRFT